MTKTAPGIDLILERDTGEARRAEPVTLGLPWPRGVLTPEAAENRLWLSGASAGRAPVQTKILERWSDGSVRWLLLHAQVDSAGVARERFRLEVEESLPAADRAAQSEGVGMVRVLGPDSYRIDTGEKVFYCGKGEGFPLTVESSLLERASLEIEAADPEGNDGEVQRAQFQSAELTVDGRLFSEIRANGSIAVGRRRLRLQVVLGFFAGQSSVAVEITVHNPGRARHRGGIWQLGDPGSVRFRELRLVLSLPAANARGTLLSSGLVDDFEVMPQEFELRQLSSGGENWQSPAHQNGSGVVPLSVRGFQVVTPAGGVLASGRRATPRLELVQAGRRLSVSMEHFWQNFPKSLAATRSAVVLGLFPACHADEHELQGGEQKTYRFTLDLSDEISSESAPRDRRAIAPAHLRATPEHYLACGIEPLLRPAAAQDPHEQIRSLALEGQNSFFAKREALDCYGWRNFGELWADHEALHHQGDEIFVSYYNNQYDGIYAFGRQYLISGDRRWFQLMDDLARHVADIDIYHTTQDKPAYSGGLFWHTAHYTKAGASTHRTYPEGSGGGGPSSEHAYAKGLMLHHFLTGDEGSRQAALSIARWLVAADDGSRLPWSLLDSGPTGAVSSTVEPGYHGPGRGPGNAIVCLLVADRLDAENPTWRRLAEQLIERCIHPDDDPTSLGLADDPERRWSYTVFLHALTEVLEWKRERDELDRTFHYARAALVRYAEWMVEHEYFYLDQPEKLEYPNDTWAAQELRKSDVLALAALEVDGARRSALIERAREFRDRGFERLLRSSELSLSRLLVLSLRYGDAVTTLLDQDVRVHGHEPVVPAEPQDFGAPQPFLARRDRLMRRFPIFRTAVTQIRRTLQAVTG